MKVQVGDIAERDVTSVEELDAVLDEGEAASRDRRQPLLASLWLDDRYVLNVGLGPDLVVLNWNDREAGQIMWVGVGSDDGEEEAWAFGSDFGFFDSADYVPAETARQAVRAFLADPSTPPKGLDWVNR